MSQPRRDDVERPTSDDPTVQVQPPPVPGRAVRAQLAAGERTTPPVRPDEPTVTLDAPAPATPHRTLAFDGPAPAEGPVASDRGSRRRWRTWPWIAAFVLVLVILGAILLVMLWQGATIDGNVDLVGWSGGTTIGWSGPGGD
ncbi:hypothetical protein [Geodermatophilus sp. CPCC 206100]|uniref:hypothetical protein n=1 Tax=Geodermatophilus sp. CPCC 206100 TaxID=3020054 RepID=UPI003AFFD8CE